ncbi:leishmanolysin-related zinc metalloendopeptidase, partial [Salmonella sp. s51228]|uniref:leishmanolysin-related zinc metalloendopeptidase n=1 Tax=Salmonella sp. s51228 TaxID=3159652 RepID=UPI0039804A1F
MARPKFSKITLAALQDSGWYSVDYSMAEPLQWGKGLGCDFVTKSCLDWRNVQSPAKAKPFCFDYNANVNYCNNDYSGYGMCGITSYTKSLEPDYQYFNSDPGIGTTPTTLIGGDVYSLDYCPTIQ